MSVLQLDDIIVKGKDGLDWASSTCGLHGSTKKKWFRDPKKHQSEVSQDILNELMETPIENLLSLKFWKEVIGHHINIEKHLRIVFVQSAPDVFEVWASPAFCKHNHYKLQEIIDLEFTANSEIGQYVIDNLFGPMHRLYITT